MPHELKWLVGAVVIGRNEGERLHLCLKSLVSDPSIVGVVYVDSASTDGSTDMAREMSVDVVDLDLSQKFTAARARNAGYRRLLSVHPEVSHVQFVDGDCEVEGGWFEAAKQAFSSAPSHLAVVCGRRRERYPAHSIYNKLCDLEWDTPVGEAMACGGDALIQTEALLRVDGYREDLIAGEEPEMCYRLRKLGYQIKRIGAPMTLHDANISRPSQWFKRVKRSGHATAEHAVLHGAGPERFGVKRTMSNVFWGFAVPGAVGAAALSVGPLLATAGGAAAYAYLYNKAYRYERRRRSDEDAKLLAASWVAGKLPEALGALSCAVHRATGKQSRLIEYK